MAAAPPPAPAFPLAAGEKFAVIAVEMAHSLVTGPLQLSEGTWTLSTLPVQLSTQWQEWIGSIDVGRLRRSNLVLVRTIASENPGILDAEQAALRQHLNDVFVLLQLSGGLEYAGAIRLTGSVLHTGSVVQQVGTLKEFYRTRGSRRLAVTRARLEEAARAAVTLQAMRATPSEFERLVRGVQALAEGLVHSHGHDRLHQFMRAIEALILPRTGRTRRDFVHHCQTFLVPNRRLEALLGEAFDMRSDTEHLHAWDRSLQRYPRAQREQKALHRTRQIEKLACAAYLRILEEAAVRGHFRTEATQASFWALPEPQRRTAWGRPLDLTRVA